MTNAKTLWLGIALAAVISPASANMFNYNLGQRAKQDDNNVYLGLTGSLYMPVQSRVRDAFDSTIPYYGITATQNNIDYNWKVRPDIGFFSANRNGNNLFIVPVMASISRKFAEKGSNFQPYAKFGVGVAYFNYRIDEISGRTSGSKVGAAASGELGLILSQRIRVFGSYSYFAKQDGFDFSGYQIGASISIFKL